MNVRSDPSDMWGPCILHRRVCLYATLYFYFQCTIKIIIKFNNNIFLRLQSTTLIDSLHRLLLPSSFFPYFPSLAVISFPRSFPLCQQMKSTVQQKSAAMRPNGTMSAATRSGLLCRHEASRLQPPGRGQWYELDWFPVKYSIELEWDIQKSSPCTSCLDFLLFHL